MTKRANKKADTFDDMVEGNGAEDDRSNAESPGSALEVYSDAPLFDTDDILIPRLRLAQGLTAEVLEGTAKAGQWIISGYEAVDEVLVVPLLFGRMQELRDQDTREMLCFSRDAKIGTGSPGGACVGCPFNEWTGGKNRRPPECSFMYAYIVFSWTHDVLASIAFQRTQIPSGKMLNTIVQRTGLSKGVVKLAATQREGKRGVFFVPVVSPAEADKKILAAAVKMAEEGL